jgi:hypothetical protein
LRRVGLEFPTWLPVLADPLSAPAVAQLSHQGGLRYQVLVPMFLGTIAAPAKAM